ncbi:MAG: hypothetical protein Q4E99_02415 [Bacillota bacterium]|nr:hypothetical protein [Bacillota bacterium]
MSKAIKIIVLLVSLALIAGLFVFLLKWEPPVKDFGVKETAPQNGELHLDGEASSVGSENQDENKNTENQNQRDENDSTIVAIKQPSGGWTEESLANQISQTVQFNTANNEVVISYAQPTIPKDYHLTFKAEIFDENGKTIDRYISDAGWLSDSNNYDPNEKVETIKMNVTSMKDKCAIISVKVGDSNLAESSTIYQLTINYDGSQVWNNAKWSAK